MTTRYAVQKEICALNKKWMKLPNVSNIENMDFTKYSIDQVNKMIDMNAKLFMELDTTLSELEAVTYSNRLKEMSIMGKIEISRDTFEDCDKIENIINHVYYKAKPAKIEAVEAVLFYLKHVGTDYALDDYEKLLEKVKARKPHPPKAPYKDI